MRGRGLARALTASTVLGLWLLGSPVSAPGQTAAAPGATASATNSDVGGLRERVAQFWAARVAGNPTPQWELLEPRGKGRVTAAEYGTTRVVKYLAYQVEDANVDGYFAVVKVRLLVQPFLPDSRKQLTPMTSVIEDRWVRIRGTWYRSLEQEEDRPQSGPTQ